MGRSPRLEQKNNEPVMFQDMDSKKKVELAAGPWMPEIKTVVSALFPDNLIQRLQLISGFGLRLSS